MTTSVGRYELLRELGRGGMAEVFLARRRGPGGVEKRLALKRIRRERASDPRMLEMFVQEARLSMSLAHKNIVPMFDFGRAGDELFLVMEYVEGADLSELMDASGTAMDPLLASFIAFEACQGLDYAHRVRDESGGKRAIVHRDVTPRNVLLSLEGEVKMTDFGVATTITDLQGGARVRGTPAYMAPEQAAGDAVDARADVFGLGLVLFEMLSGGKAYRAANKLEVLKLARQGVVPGLADSVPEPLRVIVERATAVDPEARFPSAQAMQLALDEYIISARARGSKPPGHLLGKWVSEHRASRLDAEVELGAAPSGPVHTFLDDGAGTIAQGDGTMRSIAETAIETGPEAAPQSAEAIVSPERAGRKPRLWLPLLAAGVVGAVVATVMMTRAGGGESDSAVPAAAAQDAGIARHERTVDAASVALTSDAKAAFDAAASVPDNPTDARARRTGPRPPRAKVDAGVAAALGTVRIQVNPWAKVSVVGTAQGCVETPCKLSLPPGRYQLRLHNPQSNLGKTVTVTVQSGKTADVIESLTRAAVP